MNDLLNTTLVGLIVRYFPGGSISIIRPIKRRLVGGYVERQEADDMGGGEGEGEDESQIQSKVMKLDPYQEEHAADLSPLSQVHLLSDFDLCSSNIQSWGTKKNKKKIWRLYISKQWTAV